MCVCVYIYKYIYICIYRTVEALTMQQSSHSIAVAAVTIPSFTAKDTTMVFTLMARVA